MFHFVTDYGDRNDVKPYEFTALSELERQSNFVRNFLIVFEYSLMRSAQRKINVRFRSTHSTRMKH